MGVSQAFCVIYAPVWVNRFSPLNRNATWMGFLHAFCLIGIMAGFMLAAVMITYFGDYLSWRLAIQFQGFCQLPVLIAFFFLDNSRVDVLYEQKEEKNEVS